MRTGHFDRFWKILDMALLPSVGCGPLRRRAFLGLSALLWLCAGCGCDDDIRSAEASLSILPANIDFGAVAVGSDDNVEELILRSSGAVALRFDEIRIEDDVDGVFRLLGGPSPSSLLPPGESLEAIVGFVPLEEGAYAASLVIETNDPTSPRLIEINGRARTPTIQLCKGFEDPDADEIFCEEPGETLFLDFGVVNEGEIEHRRALIRNVGRAPLLVQESVLEDGSASNGFFLLDEVEQTSIPTGGGLVLDLALAGEGQGGVMGTVLIRSNDPDHPEVVLDLLGEGKPNTPPLACAAVTRIVSLDGRVRELSDSPSEVNAWPRDRLYLTAHPSSGCSFDAEDGTNLSYHWRVVEEPEGERAFITNENSGPSPDLDLSQQPPRVTIGGVGLYKVELTVADSLGATSTADVLIDARPEDELLVELSWEVGVDLDLHLIAPGGGSIADRVFCDPLDCFWDTCRPDHAGVSTLHWGSVDGAIADDGNPDTDPILRFDNLGDSVQYDTEGVRLETLSLYEAPVVHEDLGPYIIGVGFFDSRGVTSDFEATVTVVSQGEEIYRTTREFSASDVHDFWVAGDFDAATGLGEPIDGLVHEEFDYLGSPGSCD